VNFFSSNRAGKSGFSSCGRQWMQAQTKKGDNKNKRACIGCMCGLNYWNRDLRKSGFTDQTKLEWKWNVRKGREQAWRRE